MIIKVREVPRVEKGWETLLYSIKKILLGCRLIETIDSDRNVILS